LLNLVDQAVMGLLGTRHGEHLALEIFALEFSRALDL
jgi:hypothetical protein